jgi:glutamate dehydrogenase (NADP+)
MDLKKRLQDELSQHHSYQPEFHAAVEEVLNDVIEYGQENNEELFQFLERLIEPDRTLRFKIEWVDDGGVTRVNRAWRVQFNNSLGVYKGGLRFHPTCNESVLKFLGFEQIFKNALTGLSM